jgi:uncharacterized protein YdhG (YjbR/CyaY superfamily)
VDTDKIEDALKDYASDEIATLKKYDISENDLKNLDQNNLKEKIKKVIQDKANEEINKVKSEANKTVEEVKTEAKKIAAGYVASTISLYAATLLAPEAIMVCKTKPSAMIYAGTSAFYLLQEMMAIKILKASRLGEIEVVDNMELDKNKTVNQNLQNAKDKVSDQAQYLRNYKKTLDDYFKALKKKAQNAKIAGFGFAAASAAAAAEQMDFFTGVSGSCIVSTPNHFIDHFVKNAISFFIPSLFAEEKKGSKKVVLSEDLKNNKAADYAGDLDKLGIVGGAATHLIAYMMGYKMTFLQNLMASGTSRAILFGANSALAFIVYKLFEDSATKVEAQLKKIDNLINAAEATMNNGVDKLMNNDKIFKRLNQLAEIAGVKSKKPLGEMTINELEAFAKEVENSGKNKFNEFQKNKLNELKAEIKENAPELKDKIEELKKDAKEIKNKIDEVKDKTSSFNLFHLIVGSAEANTINSTCVDKGNCNGMQLPQIFHKDLKFQNENLRLLESTSQSMAISQDLKTNYYFEKLDENAKTINAQKVFLLNLDAQKRKVPFNYSQEEKNKQDQILKSVYNYLDNLKEEDKKVFLSNFDPMNTIANINPPAVDQDARILQRILKRLEQKSHNTGVNVMSFNSYKASSEERKPIDWLGENNPDEKYDMQTDFIHDKEVNLFEVIHRKYQKAYSENIIAN